MRKDDRIRIKLILILAGLFLLAVIAAVNIGHLKKISQKEGEYMPLSRAVLLLETIEPALLEQPEFAALKQNTETFLTYGQYLDICESINKVSKEAIEFPLFQKEYTEEYHVTKEDFEKMYACFLKVFDTEGRMQTVSATVLGNAENCVPAGGEALKDGEILTKEGVYEAVDEEILSCRFQRAELYCFEGKLITVKQILDTKQEWDNIWVMESAENEGIRFFAGDFELLVSPGELADGVQEKIEREQVADLCFENGILQKGKSKTDKLNGKILNIRENSITIEGKGEFPFTDNFCAYRLYGALERIERADLIVGYDFTDFVIEDGKVCAGLVMKEETMPYIRVLLKNSDFSGLSHETVSVSCDTDFTVAYGTAEEPKTERHAAGETVEIAKNSDYVKGQRVVIAPEALSGKVKVLSLERSQGVPEYRGKLEVFEEEGALYMINEVLLEEYLYSVVPSEMPASYPEEALKAQAVCARTYAYAKMLHSPLAWYGAHVDDSTSYQVYNNVAEKAEATKAVKETAGSLLYAGEELAGTYYYSTSCGFGTDAGIWESNLETMPYLQAKAIGSEACAYTAEQLTKEEAFQSFLNDSSISSFEKEEPWYRWEYQVEELDSDTLKTRLQKRYEANKNQILTQNADGEYESKKIGSLGKIQDIYVETRNPGGVAYALIIKGEKVQIKVLTEYNIRYVLNDGEAEVTRQDGSKAAAGTLLPSAFFMISADKEGENVVGYTIKGGGYGHGLGMSQNGAKCMAASGWNYEEILLFFYEGGSIQAIY